MVFGRMGKVAEGLVLAVKYIKTILAAYPLLAQ